MNISDMIPKKRKKKIGIILFSNLRYSPYLKFYTDAISKLKDAEYKVIYFDRYKDLNEKMDEQFLPVSWIGNKGNNSSKVLKFVNFQRFERKAAAIINRENFDFLIVVPTMPSILLANILSSKYAGRYISDVRDYTYEHVKSFFKTETKVLKNAAVRVISSPGFRTFLPEMEYHVCHNIVGGYDAPVSINNQTQPIVISYIGSIGYLEQCKRLIDLVSSDSRFEFHFYGNDATGIITDYVNELHCNRVLMKGAFMPNDKPYIYERSNLVFNCYGNDRPLVKYAISNKYYDGALYRRPLLVSPNTIMQEISGDYAYALDLETANDLNDLFDWYHSLDVNMYDAFASDVVQRSLQENKQTEEAILRAIMDAHEAK